MVLVQVEIDDKMYNRVSKILGKLDALEFHRRFGIFMNNAVVRELADQQRIACTVGPEICRYNLDIGSCNAPNIFVIGKDSSDHTLPVCNTGWEDR